mgnify:CR=1 FL=1
MSSITADQRKTFNYYRRTYVRDNYRCIYCGWFWEKGGNVQ